MGRILWSIQVITLVPVLVRALFETWFEGTRLGLGAAASWSCLLDRNLVAQLANGCISYYENNK